MIRYNADGVDGLCDQPKGHHPEKLDESEQAVLLAKIFQGPDLTRDGTCAWTLADLCDFVEARFDKRLKWAYIFGAAAPETGEAFGLVLPRADTLAMSVFLRRNRQAPARKPACRHGARPSRLAWRQRPRSPGTTSPWSRCRATIPSSIRWNGFGSISDNVS